ncbi:hypothetical protein AMTRI_Chr01g110180 [Amborella trichopoda]|uniref:Plant bHLH transcription factor ACT-like domain-containing protein n=1 Tax=Amborella trichopoda TaxID=13333 RepID=W1NRI3_AMBTC|nr:uncharacterized protein LOC18425612 [Amborella trichopoda]ERM97635.1 hypothetical protein AMTR_s00130p00039420 [Amborella trichopoda]|eukprot:XP_006830219.1 uncharacterized protein LOC18425612 [Amborella trichopoda]
MVCKSHQKTVIYQNLRALRSITKSSSVKETAIILDAVRYIWELKMKVERLYLQLHLSDPLEVRTERIGKGFLVRLWSLKRDNLLVTILETFEGLGLNVLQARVSSKDYFYMEAFCVEQGERVEGHVLKQTVIEAVKSGKCKITGCMGVDC